jgi:hypothetical protein
VEEVFNGPRPLNLAVGKLNQRSFQGLNQGMKNLENLSWIPEIFVPSKNISIDITLINLEIYLKESIDKS